MGAAGILLCRFKDSLTHALIHASMGSARFSKKSGWENIRFVFKCKNIRLRGWFTRFHEATVGTILDFFSSLDFGSSLTVFLKWYEVFLKLSHPQVTMDFHTLKLYHLIYLNLPWMIWGYPHDLGNLHLRGAEQEQRLWRRLREFQLGFHQGLGHRTLKKPLKTLKNVKKNKHDSESR